MSESFNWTCPFCGRHTTITADRVSVEDHRFFLNSKHGPQYLRTTAVACPNEECKELALSASRGPYTPSRYGDNDGPSVETWSLRPRAVVRSFPDYVPQAIRDDYREACEIRERSPKASATLSRRCLQGMIRDFWGIQKDRLIDELKALQGVVDGATWNAIDALRKLGNIGAHMEKDVNLMVDVEPREAQLLVEMIETLIHEWYVVRHDRQQRLAAIVGVANAKRAQQKPAATPPKAGGTK